MVRKKYLDRTIGGWKRESDNIISTESYQFSSLLFEFTYLKKLHNLHFIYLRSTWKTSIAESELKRTIDGRLLKKIRF